VTEHLVDRYEAIFETGRGAAAPGLHWCLFTACHKVADLGPDGHPPRGSFLPPVSLPRRMWAGGTLEFHDDLSIGDHVTRRSEIRDVVTKTGRCSPLVFVTVAHEVATGPVELAPPRPVEGDEQVCRRQSVPTTLLFRYSALTENAHRIHYDHAYATGEEGYPGLVVHGPMQASWLLQSAAESGPLARVRYRGVAPLIQSEGPVAICRDGATYWTQDASGRRCMQAELESVA
jgi:3-methylfumaryl-CoA hydratase